MTRPAVLLALAALACDPPFSAPVFVAALRVTPDSATLEAGGTVQLHAVATDSAGHTLNGVSVVWTSSVGSVATVTSSGLVLGIRPGFVMISAAAQGASGAAALNVTVRITAVGFDQPPVTLVPGGSLAFSAFALDTLNDTLLGRAMTWASSDNSVVTVSTDGVATAHGVGRAFVRASTGLVRDSVAVTVRLVRFVLLTTGESDHTCGLTADSVTYCWGRNDLEQLGISSAMTSIPTPVSAASTPRFTTLAAGATFTCGGLPSGAIDCWGSSAGGRLGSGFTELTHAAPKPVQTVFPLSGVSAGWAHACGLAGGVPVCWGRDPGAGGPFPINWTPNAVPTTAAMGSLTAGQNFTCAISVNSAAFCWGDNEAGELGNGAVGGSYAAVAVAGGLSFAQLAAGWSHACGLTSAGAAYCWGLNSVGQLGTGDTATIQATPATVAGGLVFTAIAAGGNRTCALTAAGALYCWGNGLAYTPALAGGTLSFTSITVGDDNVCGIGTDGTSYCWGGNAAGQVGDGTFVPRTAPTRVLGQP